MARRLLLFYLLFLSAVVSAGAQGVVLSGRVLDSRSQKPVEFASVLLTESGLWAITDEKGQFRIQNVPQGKATLTVQCLCYAKSTTLLNIKEGMKPLTILLQEDDLRLDEVTVMAKRKEDAATTSYSIDRKTLDNQQMLNLGEIATLLPGGKTVNGSLTNDSRMALRAAGSEKGNASFGTAIEVDGMRLDNNAETDETLAASTRTLSSSNIESVEVVTGVPSVEYGDLSNGVVKVQTRRGKSPFIVEGKLNQHTRQISLNKGFELGRHGGMLNASLEHARSFTNIVSPHTAYQRNILSIHYMNVFMRNRMPLTLNVGLSGNVGGYNSEADPDEDLDDYQKMRDNNLRGNLELNWLLNRPWITSVQLRGSFAVADKLTEQYASKSSAATQAQIHSLHEGYFIAQDYDTAPSADIILGPTGYWYQRSYNDAKPRNYSLKLKAEWSRRWKRRAEGLGSEGNEGGLRTRLMVGAELTGSHNNGRGTYYEDMRYAPTWREYRYDELPWMHNLALYAENTFTLNVGRGSVAELTAGLRDDLTMISGSDYGTVSSLSPRFNGRYVFWRGRKAWFSDLSVHAGWGKSVKLPSFQVLYPRPSYSDLMAFASTSTQDNRSYYAYHTFPSKAIYNPDLRWQYTNQTDLGVEFTVKGTRVSISTFHHRSCRSYMPTDIFTPFAYKYTPPSALERCGIALADRQYAIDQQTGIVTVSDVTGRQQAVQLDYNERRTYVVNSRFVNASPVDRYGVEWIVDFAQIKALRTQLRIDGNYYEYRGLDDMLISDIPLGATSMMSGSRLYQYVGWYRGCNSTGTSYSANASVANGSISHLVNLNATLTTHIPKIRMIVSLRLETTLQNYRRPLSELPDGTRGIVVESASDFFGEPYDGTSRDKNVAIYPDYYATWENPGELIPFAEKLSWARDNDPTLFSDLTRLIVFTNYPYTMNPNSLSRYSSANISVTKEIGDHVSVSFYANNFFNNMSTVRSSQTGLETSLFSSSYIPSYYYGLSLRVKI